MLKNIYKHRINILLIIILILAAYLRLYRISDYMTFLGDEGRDLIEVKKILSGDLVFLGPRSSAADFYYGPIYFYLITPFLWLFNYDPVGPAVFIALLGVVTVYLVYYVGKELLNERVGLIAAALYAVSPLVIAYSRSSWNPNPMPFVSLLLLFSAYKAIKDYSFKYFILSGVLMGIAMQLQYIAIFLGVILALFVISGSIIEKKTRSIIFIIKSYFYIMIGFIIGWSPFLAFEIKHGFPNLKTIVNYIFYGGTDATSSTSNGFIQNVQSVAFQLFGRLLTRFPPPEQLSLDNNISLQALQIGTLILGIGSLFAVFKIKNRLTKCLLFIWFFVGVILFGFYKKDVYDYYLGFMFSLPFLLVGNLISMLWNDKVTQLSVGKAKIKLSGLANYSLMALSVGAFLSLLIFNFAGNPFRNTPNRQKEQVKEIAKFIISKTNNKPYNFALLTNGNSDHGYRYYLDILNHQPITLLYEGADPQRKSVTDQLLVVCEDPDCQPVGAGLWEVAGFGKAEIEGVWSVSVVKVYRLIHVVE